MNRNSKELLLKFGQRIRELRRSAGLSQEELADLCNLHRTYIGSVERGERNVTLSTIASIACALRVDPAILIPSVESCQSGES